MFNRILTALGVTSAPSLAPPSRGPYKDDSANLIYQLLFCDRPQLFEESQKGMLAPPWSVLFSKTLDFEALAGIAGDTRQESHVRILAFNLLRAARKKVPAKEHLGTIVEVGLPEGLDTLATFVDRGARYINHSGKMVIVEGPSSPFDREIEMVLQASKPIVSAIGPWDKDRLPPPTNGRIRMTFLVSDGLYFGEGPMDAMNQDPMARPLISAATTLLLRLVEKTSQCASSQT